MVSALYVYEYFLYNLTPGYIFRLVFTTPDKVDAIWNRLAREHLFIRQAHSPRTFNPPSDSLVSGPLAQTSAFLAKVSTTPKSPVSTYQHVICVYLPNVFDKDEVTKVP
jgi:hypothetical protein